ncbi:potassium-transporting ATPase subunit KdpC [Desulfosporosinus shakirovi]|uniref:potassium-transporting ATPase subunit KdpC n=1 Tax=Desulfosporosinus shakirovi TaxID=2885154 RepID=UPI001E37834F|nr:potassium-transporting ATPase subunit KdpC [Desulfosporosinus sp. SRJS8]MCB8817540.1 potassium-transporting ATPase subunit KdpC [Desulfosporosinus sp. SRJS8]
MSKIIKVFRPAILCFVVMTLLCGVIYPGVVTGIAQAVFPKQANGSIISVTLNDGTKKDFGSALIAQEFTKPEYMIGRPMGTTNLSPVGEEQEKLVKERIDWWHALDPNNTADIPMDLVTASGSGVDPNITPEAAEYQIARIARERGIREDAVREIINKNTTGRFLGFWGEPAVNVLKVNLGLDSLL